MDFPLLEIEWTNPLPDERIIFKRRIIEIFSQRIAILGFFALLLIAIAFFTKIYILIVLPNLLFVICFPLFINPWDVILSDKRLILRKRYWLSGRLSTIRSVNLYHVESQRFSPRLKIIPITIGFFIIESFSLVLVEYALTRTPPLPLIIEIIILIGKIIGLGRPVEENIRTLIEIVYLPFLPVALFVGASSLIIGLILIILGLPYRTSFYLSIQSGHTISINAGVPKKLTTLIFSVCRAQRVQTKPQFWQLNIPLLEDEEVKTSAKVALIDHKTQFIGVLSLYFILSSLNHFIGALYESNWASLIAISIYLINILIIALALRFAKRYRQIVVTNERMIFEDEYSSASGLWGKRLYQYADLPHKFIQGFQVSNFTTISIFAILGSILIFFLGINLSTMMNHFSFFFVSLIVILLYLIFSYKIHTSFRITTVGGKKIEFTYQIPVIWKNLSQKIEYGNRIYNFLFYNVLHEKKIAEICNLTRNITNPIQLMSSKGKQTLAINAFLPKTEKILEKWEKVNPVPFLKGSLVLGFILSVICLIILLDIINPLYKGLFILIGLCLILTIFGRSLLIFSRTLVITNKRLFYIFELQPRTLAILFGRLPEWTIIETLKEYVEVAKIGFHFPVKFLRSIFKDLSILIFCFIVIYNRESMKTYLSVEISEILLFLIALLVIMYLMLGIRDIVYSLPRYSLLIQLRYGLIDIPYIYHFQGLNVLMIHERVSV
ncbi:MAG: hypothetical protein ACFFAE_02065 [Candidatus Hodarchaeota archaeon]